MNNVDLAIIAAASAAIIIALIITVVSRRRMSETMNRLEKMVKDVIQGDFRETEYKESRVSKLEAEMANYLAASSISERNLKEEKEKIKSLISDISHQTKTPLANLKLYCELLEESGLNEDAEENVNAIKSETRRLEFLADALIKMSRLETGIIKLNPQLTEIGPVISEITEQYRAKAENKGISLTADDNIDSKALFDRKWTVEAIGNIVDNAVKYTDKGQVRISVTEYELFTGIVVSDTGKGISEEESSKIFKRFYRSETVREKEGIGVGLYLAREIISGQGGYIKVSGKLGEGSVFSVFLPKL